jgi:hypothetical protein
MAEDSEQNEWNRLYFPDQKEKLVKKISTILEQIVNIPQLKSLSENIILGKKFYASIDFGPDIRPGSIYDYLLLTKEGVVENYYTTARLKKKIFWKIPYTVKEYVDNRSDVNIGNFPKVAEKYLLSPKALQEIKDSLEL